MRKLLLTLSLSLAALPIYADEMSPTKGGQDLPPPRTTAPKPAAVPLEATPAVAAPQASPAVEMPPPSTATPAAVVAPAETAPAARAMPADAVPVAMAVPTPASDWYGNINTGITRAELDSGGFNLSGPHPNTGNDHDGFEFGFLGLSVGRTLGNNLRLEAEFTGRNSKDFTTNSFEPPTPTFFYDSSAKTYSGMLNLFYDHPISSQWSAFAGAGLGVAFVDLKTSDGMTSGSGTDANLAWQGMLGAAYHFDKANSLNFGYRYFDAGNTNISLYGISSGASAGNFKADLNYHDIFVGWQHSL